MSLNPAARNDDRNACGQLAPSTIQSSHKIRVFFISFLGISVRRGRINDASCFLSCLEQENQLLMIDGRRIHFPCLSIGVANDLVLAPACPAALAAAASALACTVASTGALTAAAASTSAVPPQLAALALAPE